MSSVNLELAFSPSQLKSYFEEAIRDSAGRGIDGINGLAFSNNLDDKLSVISKKIKSRRYRFSPYLEVVKSKGRGKTPRIISKPVVKDKLVLYAIKEELHKLFPECIPNKLPNTYIRDIKEKFRVLDCDNTSYLKVDIKGFYDNLTREAILEKVGNASKNENFISLIKRSLINKTVPKGYRKKDSKKYTTDKGVPQGLSISNILAEIYMEDFDKFFKTRGLGYYRYVDDILIFAENSEIDQIELEIKEQFEIIDLSIHDQDQEDKKSEKGSVKEHFQYLGYKVSSEKVTVKESTVNRYIESLISMFTKFKHGAKYQVSDSKFLKMDSVKEIFILELNDKITGALSDNKKYGWMFYFIEIDDIYLLHKIDGIIKKQFERLELFSKKAPENRTRDNELGVCSLVRTYYEIKYNLLGNYVHNYSKYDSRSDKLSYLVKFGLIAHYDGKTYTDDEINQKFFAAKKSKLLKLELDVGKIS